MSLSKIELKIHKNYWTNSLGLARSLLALCTLVTLLFNKNEDLFITTKSGELLKETSLNLFAIIPNINIAIFVSCVILIIVILGFYPRYTAVFHAWVAYSFFTGSFLIEGGDQVAMLLSAALIPILVFDTRKNHWHKGNQSSSFWINLIAYFSYYAIIIQISVIYFHSAVGKFSNPSWTDGTAVYYWFNDPTFGMSDAILPFVNELLKNPLIVTAITWGTLICELLLFSRLFFIEKKYIRLMFILGIFFHFMIIICFGLVSFFFAMAGAIVLYSLWTDDFMKIFKNWLNSIKSVKNVF